jgi:hypothetical protein
MVIVEKGRRGVLFLGQPNEQKSEMFHPVLGTWQRLLAARISKDPENSGSDSNEKYENCRLPAGRHRQSHARTTTRIAAVWFLHSQRRLSHNWTTFF